MLENINSPYILEATSDNFHTRVIENSERGPVLVNFWSRKAGPCLRLYPVLDQIVHHYAGKLLLINVDTENELQYTREYGVASVPTLKLFRHGQVVETLHGYQSDTELKKVLDRYVARDSDLKLADAIELYVQGNARQAYELIADTIVEDPDNVRLPLAMCKLLKHEGRYAEALKLIDSLPEKIRQDREVSQLYDEMSFYIELDTQRDLETLQTEAAVSPADPGVLKQLCLHAVVQNNYEQGLQYLVRIMEQDAAFEQNFAQKAMLKIFNILGNTGPLVSEYRTQLRRYTH